MKQKIFLTSCIAMGFVAPAFAEPTNTGTFPTNGLMQEDYTYTNAATADNMDSVYEGTVNATAEYTDIFYDIVAGNYLAAGSDDENGTICPAGSYCSGLTDALYNATDDQGLTSCPTEYASSAEGASSQNECYRTCSGNVTIAHATGVTGNDYYGTGTDTCTPTACENGYHVMGGVLPRVNKDTLDFPLFLFYALKEDIPDRTEEYHGMHVHGNSLNTAVANDAGMYATINENYKVGIIGQGVCNTISGSVQPYNAMSISDDYLNGYDNYIGFEGRNGQNCWCSSSLVLSEDNPVFSQQIRDTFQGQTIYYMPTVSNWVNVYSFDSTESCVNSCATACAMGLVDLYQALNSEDSSIKAEAEQTFNVLYTSSAGRCEANIININWINVDPDYAGQNNEGTATYGEDVRTPVKAETIKGKTFKGWRFSKPEQTTTGGSN